MREVNDLYSVLFQMLEAAAPAVAVADGMPIDKLVESIKRRHFRAVHTRRRRVHS